MSDRQWKAHAMGDGLAVMGAFDGLLPGRFWSGGRRQSIKSAWGYLQIRKICGFECLRHLHEIVGGSPTPIELSSEPL